MMEWVGYDFYLYDYLAGKDPVIPESDFAFFARDAAAHIAAYIGTPPEIDNTVKLCCCEVAELLWRHDHTAGGSDAVTSEKTGDLSVTYDSSEARTSVLSCRVRGCVYKYFADTGLLYRGLD